jgi:hypothetical protein
MHAPCHIIAFIQNNDLPRGAGKTPPPRTPIGAKSAGKIYRLPLKIQPPLPRTATTHALR